MRTDRLTFEEQPTFERVVVGLTGVGAAAGFLQLPLETIGRHGWPMTVS